MNIREQLLQRLDDIDPGQYGKTRNYVSGRVTELGPFISRGVIDTRTVWENLLAKGYDFEHMYCFIQQLAWRDFFQRVWQKLGDGINLDIRRPQEFTDHNQMPVALAQGETEIEGIDGGIQRLLKDGYMHNHVRMYTAFLGCNLARSHWRLPAQWMYAHLLDGDWASNALSWQWVAGTFSNKKYIANQENINRYTGKAQRNTFLDLPYEDLPDAGVPLHLTNLVGSEGALPFGDCNETSLLAAVERYELTLLTPSDELGVGSVVLFNYYEMSFQWQSETQALRVLLLEPSVFAKYPISKKCVDFLCSLAKEIAGLRVFVGEFGALAERLEGCEIHFREHPLNQHYQGQIHSRNWLAPSVTGEFTSFFGYWKQVEKSLRQEYKSHRKMQ